MTSFHDIRRRDVTKCSLPNEFLNREKRPPYFASILLNGKEGINNRGSSAENGRGDSKEDHISKNMNGDNNSKKGAGSISGEADAAAGKQTSGNLSIASFKESNNLYKDPNLPYLLRHNVSNIATRATSSSRLSPQPSYPLSTSSFISSSPICSPTTNVILPTWRLKERMKTVGVCLVLALNIGTDPPDVNRPTPCAKLLCWMDPTIISRSKAREQIGEKLEHQYAKLQQRVRFKRALDPTVEEVRSLCLTMRRHAKNERLLLHYNGHGVPRPTANGEIWLFDQKYTQYIPLSISDLRQWIGKPSILVLDCSGAGVLIPFLAAPLEGLGQYIQQQVSVMPNSNNNANASNPNATSSVNSNVGMGMGIGIGSSTENPMNATNIRGGASNAPMSLLSSTSTIISSPQINTNTKSHEESELASRSVRDCIVLCPCAEGEMLPMNPEFPADIFTSCLTTPIPIALRWFAHQNPLSMEGVDPESFDRIPGKENDRKTPLGELNWIFTAITDTIAWNVLPSPLFQRLFREDLLVSSMFRNFLLADRILRSLNCTPMSLPSLPSTCNHPLWQAWDLAVETCLHQLMRDGHLNTEPVPPTQNPSSMVDNNRAMDGKIDAQVTDHEQKHKTTHALNPPSSSKLIKPFNSPVFTTHAVAPTKIPTIPKDFRLQPQPPLNTSNITSPFFAEQLTAFEIWLEFASMKAVTNNNIGLLNTVKLHENNGMESPEQLPVVLQVLLSQAHRVRALVLLKSFLDLGPWAVNLALSVGIFPYVLKLLKSHVDEYKHVLVGIWANILAFDPSCQVDLVKEVSALEHFIGHLNWGLTPTMYTTNSPICGANANKDLSSSSSSPPKKSSNIMHAQLQPQQRKPQQQQNQHQQAQQSQQLDTKVANKKDAAKQRTMAAFILSIICHEYPLGQNKCLKQNLHKACADLLSSLEINTISCKSDNNSKGVNGNESEHETKENKQNSTQQQELEFQRRIAEENVPPQFRLWLCICLGNLWKDCNIAQEEAYESVSEVHRRVYARLEDDSADVRVAAAYALGCLIGNAPTEDEKRRTTNANNSRKGSMIPTHALIPPTRMRNVGLPTMNAYRNTVSPSSAIGNMREGAIENGPQVANLGSFMADRNTVASNYDGLGRRQHELIPQYYPSGKMIGQMIPTPQPTNPISPFASSPFPNQSTQNIQQTLLFQDSRRLSYDLETADELIKATNDASAVVRYEATLALACLVEKYFSAFAVVADEMSFSSTLTNLESKEHQSQNEAANHNTEQDAITSRAKSHDENNNRIESTQFPPGLDRSKLEHFRDIWKAIRFLQHNDPHPAPANAANDVVSVVHYKRAQSMISMSGTTAISKNHSLTLLSQSNNEESNVNGPTIDSNAIALRHSQFDPSKKSDQMNNTERSNRGLFAPKPLPVKHDKEQNVHCVTQNGSNENICSGMLESPYRIEYCLPKSQFLAWKRKEFEEQKKSWQMNPCLDPLSPAGAINVYRSRRNLFHDEKGRYLQDFFVALAPKPSTTSRNDMSRYPTATSSYINNSFKDDKLYDDLSNDEATAKANANLELEVSDKKKILQFRQSSLLHNDGVQMTSCLRFHSYEPALVVCDGCDGISVWDVSQKNNNSMDHNNRVCVFQNGNPPKSRMTSTAWVNEETNSMLLVASDDGTVKVWDGLIKNEGGLSNEKPTLASSFFANPDLVAGQRGSGLVTEWQQYSGKLIAGGNGEWIRCWDLEAEKCVNRFSRKESDACVTTLTTAWDAFSLNEGIGDSNNTGLNKSRANGYSGIGPNIIVAGYGNGNIKIFDIRSSQSDSIALNSGSNSRMKNVFNNQSSEVSKTSIRRGRLMEYNEHKSWIVNTVFNGHGGRYELISGCITGDIKFWDLRYPSSSIRTFQRNPMTALAAHPRIPMLVTGSHAQFIKMFTMDGDTLSVIRYHEFGQRIGPISCLTFHPNRLMLAAGTTDEIVSIYGPRSS